MAAGKAALVVSDESNAGPYITGGVMRLPSANLDAAANALSRLKRNVGVPSDAKMHCRVMFHPDPRRKSPFKELTSEDLHTLVRDCVAQMNTLGASWSGAWVDQTQYPKELQLVDGKRFAVTPKHLAGLVYTAALMGQEDFDLAFDPDPTKIDWGLARVKCKGATSLVSTLTLSNCRMLINRCSKWQMLQLTHLRRQD